MLASSLPALILLGFTSANILLVAVVGLRVGPGRAQSLLMAALANPALAVAGLSLVVCLVAAMTPAQFAGGPPAERHPSPA